MNDSPKRGDQGGLGAKGRPKPRRSADPWRDDNLGSVLRADFKAMEEGRPSIAVWNSIAKDIGVAKPTGLRRLMIFVSGRLGRSSQSLMSSVAMGALALTISTLSATSVGVILSGASGGDPQAVRVIHASGLPTIEAEIQPVVAGRAFDRRPPPGVSVARWWYEQRLANRLRGIQRPFYPACEIFHVRSGAGQAQQNANGCTLSGAQRGPSGGLLPAPLWPDVALEAQL